MLNSQNQSSDIIVFLSIRRRFDSRRLHHCKLIISISYKTIRLSTCYRYVVGFCLKFIPLAFSQYFIVSFIKTYQQIN
jgi:hypothetical protein